MEKIKSGDLEILLAGRVEKAIDVTVPDLPKGDQTLEDLRQTLEEALLFDLEHMLEVFGGGRSEEEFTAFLEENFSAGIVPKRLDPIFAFGDFQYTETIQNSSVASLGFDLSSFWPMPGIRSSDVAMLAFASSGRATLPVLDLDVGLDIRAARKLVQHRDGPDGTYGTADDNHFDDVSELAGIPYVGRAAIEKLRRYVLVQLDEDSSILLFVNSSLATLELLDSDVALDRRAAQGIVGQRDGPDGRFGTTDDDPFDTIRELGEVPFVGESAIDRLRQYLS